MLCTFWPTIPSYFMQHLIQLPFFAQAVFVNFGIIKICLFHFCTWLFDHPVFTCVYVSLALMYGWHTDCFDHYLNQADCVVAITLTWQAVDQGVTVSIHVFECGRCLITNTAKHLSPGNRNKHTWVWKTRCWKVRIIIGMSVRVY